MLKTCERLTEVSVGGVGALPTGPAPRGPGRGPLPRVHLAGLGDGGHQVLVLRVPPAPPADLWLAAAGDDRPVLLVPVGGGGSERAATAH